VNKIKHPYIAQTHMCSCTHMHMYTYMSVHWDTQNTRSSTTEKFCQGKVYIQAKNVLVNSCSDSALYASVMPVTDKIW